MTKTIPEVLQYIVDNIKPYGYVRYGCFISCDGIALNKKYDPVTELYELEEKCKGLRNYILQLGTIKAAINDSSKLSLTAMEYVKNYIDHPDSNNHGFNVRTLRTPNSYWTSSEILMEANLRASQTIEYEYVVKAIDDIISNLKKDPKFYNIKKGTCSWN